MPTVTQSMSIDKDDFDLLVTASQNTKFNKHIAGLVCKLLEMGNNIEPISISKSEEVYIIKWYRYIKGFRFTEYGKFSYNDIAVVDFLEMHTSLGI